MSGLGGDVELLDPAAVGEDIRGRWRELALARENPFLTPEWFDAWQDPEGGEGRIAAWRRQAGGEVGAVLPLVLEGGALRPRSLCFPGAGNGDWFGLACSREDEDEAGAACLAALYARRGEWDVLRLDRVEGFTAGGGGAEAALGLTALRRPEALPLIEFGKGGYEGWLESRSRNFRSQLGRRRRGAERGHRLELEGTPEEGELGAALETLFGFHRARRAMQGGEGVLDERARRSYARFAELSLARGWLRMHTLLLDEEPTATWCGWRIGGRYMYGISGFDPRYERLAVGTILLGHTIERAAAEGAAVYDFLWGEEAYKERYATGRREVVSLAAASGARGRLALAAHRGRNAAARALPVAARRRLRMLSGRASRG